MRGFCRFDAPASLVLTYDRVLDFGATCHFDLGALRSDIVREVASIPDDSFPANAVRSERTPAEEFMRYVGFH